MRMAAFYRVLLILESQLYTHWDLLYARQSVFDVPISDLLYKAHLISTHMCFGCRWHMHLLSIAYFYSMHKHVNNYSHCTYRSLFVFQQMTNTPRWTFTAVPACLGCEFLPLEKENGVFWIFFFFGPHVLIFFLAIKHMETSFLTITWTSGCSCEGLGLCTWEIGQNCKRLIWWAAQTDLVQQCLQLQPRRDIVTCFSSLILLHKFEKAV